MDFAIHPWLDELGGKIKQKFGTRVWFFGYQGSVRRGEATAESDIDIVLILDALEIQDLSDYRAIIRSMPGWEKACGFVSGKRELLSWPAAELFYFYYDTQPIFGDLEELKTRFTRRDIAAAVKQEAANLYHAACHSFLFDEPAAQLKQMIKTVFFIELGIVFLQNGVVAETKRSLFPMTTGEDREILELALSSSAWGSVSPERVTEIYAKLIDWAGRMIQEY